MNPYSFYRMFGPQPRRARTLWPLALALFLALTLAHPVLAESEPTLGAQPLTASGQGTIPDPNILKGCGGEQVAESQEEFEAQVVALVNTLRGDQGLPPLKRVVALDGAARFHAADMGVEDYFSHTSYDKVNGELVESCAWSDRIGVYYGDWQALSENIAAGFAAPRAVVDGWMASPGHRRNLLSAGVWEIGVGYFQGAGLYNNYWVQDFGRRPDVYPLVIDKEAPSTDSGDLSLYIYGDWQEVRLRNDDGPWSDWQPFQTPLPWRLEGLPGVHTVHAEMRSQGGALFTASDEIRLAQSNVQPQLNPMPDSLLFLLHPDSGQIAPERYEIQPLSTPLPGAYSWQIQVEGNWISATPAQGVGPEVVQIIPTATGAGDGRESQATLTVTLRDGGGNLLDQHNITLSRLVTAGLHQKVFLPTVAGR